MKKIIAGLSLIIAIAIALASCNFPSAQEISLTVEQQAATIVAQTLTAVAAENLVPLASPTAGATEQPLASPTASGGTPTLQLSVTPTATTGTPGATILTVDSNTNCREGPGLDFAIVIVLVPGTNYQMIARAADNKYWVVTEIGKPNACWVPAEMSNAFGNVNLLSVTTPAAPTSSVGPIQAPTGLWWSHDCTSPPNIKVNLGWTDRSNNETGFRVYRDGALVVDLPANSTTYTDLFAGSATVLYSYRVSAYNAAGEAMGGTISFSCQ